MASRPAQKARQRASQNGGPPRQPKAGSPSQREMVERLANRIMEVQRSYFEVDLARAERGDADSELAFRNGQPVTSAKREGEHVTYKEWKADLKEVEANIEASFPALMPAVRKLIRKTRKELDAQE